MEDREDNSSLRAQPKTAELPHQGPTASVPVLPWQLIQEDVRPFALVIKSGDEIVLEERRWARSSADTNLADCIDCIHFGPEDRDEAVAGNAKQIAKLAFVVTACNAHDDLVVALRELVPFLDDLDDATDAIGVYPDVSCTRRCRDAVIMARAALAKAGHAPETRGEADSSNPRT